MRGEPEPGTLADDTWECPSCGIRFTSATPPTSCPACGEGIG